MVFPTAPTAAPVIDLPLSFHGLSVSTGPSGDLVLADASGNVVARAPAPQLFDATVAPGTGVPLRRVTVASSVVTRNGAQVLEMRPDPGFLSDPATRYPVTLDPTVNLLASLDTHHCGCNRLYLLGGFEWIKAVCRIYWKGSSDLRRL